MSKRIVSMMIALAAVSTMAMSVSAANDDEVPGSGEVIVSARSPRAVTSGYIYDSNNAQRGYWIRGNDNGTLTSKFKAYIGKGRASVTSGTGVYVDGGWKDTEVMSEATTPWTSSGTNKANYDYKD